MIDFRQLCEKYQTLLITSGDINLPESDQLRVFQVKGNSTHRYNFAWIKTLRKILREDQIKQIVICSQSTRAGGCAVMNQSVNFNFNMSTFLHGKRVDFINEQQYQIITDEQVIVQQCLNLLTTEDIYAQVQNGDLRLVGAIIQPDGYWRTIFINGFEVNQQRLLN